MSRLRGLTSAITLLLFSSPLFAQATAPIRDTTAAGPPPAFVAVAVPASTAIDRGAAVALPAWATPRAETVGVSRLPPPWSYGEGSHTVGTAMMIVGGVGLLVGTVVSGKTGTHIMIGSGLLGLAGLWIYAK